MKRLTSDQLDSCRVRQKQAEISSKTVLKTCKHLPLVPCWMHTWLLFQCSFTVSAQNKYYCLLPYKRFTFSSLPFLLHCQSNHNSWFVFVYFYSATLSQQAYVFSGCSTNMLEKVWVQVGSEKVTECQTEARRSKSQVVIPLAGAKEGCIQVSVVGKPAATYVLPRVRKPQANSRHQDDGFCLWGCTIFYSIRYFTLRHFSKHHCRTRVQNPATTAIHINQTHKKKVLQYLQQNGKIP